jgi:hypothetical protein
MTWMTNSAGKPDSMLTLGVVSLAVILLKFFFSDMSFGAISFGNLDGGVVTAILGSTLGAYVMRRYTDANASKKDDDNAK